MLSIINQQVHGPHGLRNSCRAEFNRKWAEFKTIHILAAVIHDKIGKLIGETS